MVAIYQNSSVGLRKKISKVGSSWPRGDSNSWHQGAVASRVGRLGRSEAT